MCVSSLVIDEIKRIIKSSEIMKYTSAKRSEYPQADSCAGKMIANGHKRIRMAVKNLKLGWEMNTSLSRYAQELMSTRKLADHYLYRRPRSDRLSMLLNLQTRKDCGSSIIWSRI